MNVNFLGEALLGEAEAQRRLELYLSALQIPEIEVISVKISTIYSQVSSLAFEHTVSVLCDRLGAAVSGCGQRALSTQGWQRGVQVRVPRHGGVSRPGGDYGGLSADPRPQGLATGRRGDRSSSLPPRLLPGPEENQRLGQGTDAERRSAGNDPAGEGRQPGDGTCRGVAAGLGASAVRVKA